MLGFEFVRDPGKRARAGDRDPGRRAGPRGGLILLKAGIYGNVIRNLVPLVITDAQLAEALDVLESAISEAATPATVALSDPFGSRFLNRSKTLSEKDQ